jgi:6-phosphofructokinase 1
MRIAINTGGGDAPGLNAVLRAAALAAARRGFELFGIRRGYDGLLAGEPLLKLDSERVRGITYLGGTILGTTNRGNPFQWTAKDTEGRTVTIDRSDEVVKTFKRLRIDALIAVGGDGSLKIAQKLMEKGLPVVGVPKTIDNDLAATEVTFGFDTAVATAADAIGKLHSTAESHERVMVVEVMGRYAGWIAIESGLAASADVILIPEIPYDLEKVADKILDREAHGRRFSIVVVAEGAKPAGGELTVKAAAHGGRSEPLLGGIADRIARELQERTGKETRSLVLGHLQRGGGPTARDRLIALRFGAAAIEAVEDGAFGTMVALRPPKVVRVPIAEAVAAQKLVPIDGDEVMTARELGISLGD